MLQTLIEFFDKSPLENVVCSLLINPKKIIFLGPNGNEMERQKNGYLNFFHSKGINVSIECRAINRNNLNQIQYVLSQVTSENTGCALDITGGDELSLVAVGTMTDFLKEKQIPLYRVNIQTRKAVEFLNIIPEFEYDEPALSVSENITLYGGSIVYDGDGDGGTRIWNLDGGFKNDVFKLWEICRSNNGSWNSQISTLAKMFSPNNLNVVIRGIGEKSSLSYDFGRYNWKFPWKHWIFRKMAESELIYDFLADEDGLSFRFKNKQIQKSLSKAGTVLELFTYIAAHDLLEADGSSYFNDVMTEVNIDWDGGHRQNDDFESDTKNEIDVLAMRGLIPVFISCKNGLVEENELYKLNTVAERFGGEYSKKILVATNIERKYDGLKSFRQRAKDMNIHLINDVHLMDAAELARRIKVIV